ncbi:MAG: ATP-binding protein [Gemmatimonadota bacterium]
MALSLRQQILWWSVGSSLAILLIAFFFIDDAFQTMILRSEQENLVARVQLLNGLQSAEIVDAQDRTANLASTPTMRAAMETLDSATIRQNLDVMIRDSGMEWVAIAGPDGRILATTVAAPARQLAAADALIREARHYDTGDLWYFDGRLVQVHASGIFFGPSVLGVLVSGMPIGAERVERLQMATQQRIAFLADTSLVAGGDGLTDAQQQELVRTWRSNGVATTASDPESAAVREFTLAGERYLGTAVPLPDAAGDRRGSLVAFRSLEAAMRPARDLRVVLLAIAGVAVLLAFASSYVLSRRVTRPANRLLQETVRLGSGDLDQPITPERDDEIGKLAAGFDQMRISLRETRAELVQAERLSAVGRAASAIVHDFRQPVTAIQGYIGLLRDDWEDEAQRREDFATIDQELHRLNAMMSEILDFASGGDRIDPTEGSTGDLLDEVARAVRPVFADGGIDLRVTPGHAGTARLDFPRTRRILENLLRNAAAAVATGGTVWLRSEATDEGVRFVVEDTGPGIPEEVRERIFEPFVTHGKRDGTGLGLAIVKAFTERQGGTVSFETSTSGTKFLLDFPAEAAA